MIIYDSFSRLTMCMIAHDSFRSAVFPDNRPARFKIAAKSSSAAESEICVYIQNDNHDT